MAASIHFDCKNAYDGTYCPDRSTIPLRYRSVDHCRNSNRRPSGRCCYRRTSSTSCANRHLGSCQSWNACRLHGDRYDRGRENRIVPVEGKSHCRRCQCRRFGCGFCQYDYYVQSHHFDKDECYHCHHHLRHQLQYCSVRLRGHPHLHVHHESCFFEPCYWFQHFPDRPLRRHSCCIHYEYENSYQSFVVRHCIQREHLDSTNLPTNCRFRVDSRRSRFGMMTTTTNYWDSTTTRRWSYYSRRRQLLPPRVRLVRKVSSCCFCCCGCCCWGVVGGGG
mmetsp:Transcript_33612/g.52226  ORF Transcript_33612/g.52226 Transcript_33612/m.52226 type:complete len:277 (+) Transcript_33612:77-907(+)